MNEFILKTMRSLDDPELFTVSEMRRNAEAAAINFIAIDTITAVADAADAAAYYARNAARAYADYVTGAIYVAAVLDASQWLERYFKLSGENKQLYINEVERLK